MNRRGSAALLVLLLIAAVAATALVVSTRREVTAESDDARRQALWLARSALDAGVRGHRVVETPLGAAEVDASAKGVRVTLAGGVALVEASPYSERYERP